MRAIAPGADRLRIEAACAYRDILLADGANEAYYLRQAMTALARGGQGEETTKARAEAAQRMVRDGPGDRKGAVTSWSIQHYTAQPTYRFAPASARRQSRAEGWRRKRHCGAWRGGRCGHRASGTAWESAGTDCG